MTHDIWLGLARHLLTTAGGFFVAKGYVDADSMNTIVGSTVAIAGAAWSIADKKKKR